MYSLLVAATVLFTVQFLFQQQYRKSHGAGLEAMLNFSFCTGCIGCLLMLVLNGFHLRITAFAVGMAIAYSVSSLPSKRSPRRTFRFFRYFLCWAACCYHLRWASRFMGSR